MILTSNGRPPPARAASVSVRFPVRLMPCLMICLATLSGCERNQQPGPGPKPISGSAATTPATTPTTPSATAGASGTQAAPR